MFGFLLLSRSNWCYLKTRQFSVIMVAPCNVSHCFPAAGTAGERVVRALLAVLPLGFVLPSLPPTRQPQSCRLGDTELGTVLAVEVPLHPLPKPVTSGAAGGPDRECRRQGGWSEVRRPGRAVHVWAGYTF